MAKRKQSLYKTDQNQDLFMTSDYVESIGPKYKKPAKKLPLEEEETLGDLNHPVAVELILAEENQDEDPDALWSSWLSEAEDTEEDTLVA